MWLVRVKGGGQGGDGRGVKGKGGLKRNKKIKAGMNDTTPPSQKTGLVCFWYKRDGEKKKEEWSVVNGNNFGTGWIGRVLEKSYGLDTLPRGMRGR